MKVALEVWTSDFDQVVSTCATAERSGFDGFYYGESPTELNLDCWTTLAALAQATDRIRLGPVITNILGDYRSLALLAKQAATVAIISGGRLDFRTGAGAATSYGKPWWEPYGVRYGSYEERLAATAAALSVLEPFWRNEPVSFTPNVQAELGIACPPIPITVAATGPRAMRLAATAADVWETSFCTPSEFAERKSSFPTPAGGARPTRSLEIDAFVGTTPERAASVIDTARRARGSAGEDLGPILARALTGAPSAVAQQLDDLAGVGVEQVVVALHDPHDRDALDALAEAAALCSSHP